MFPLTLDDLTSAFHRVAANEGCAGVDGVTISDFARDLDNHLKTLLRHCQSALYRPLPLHRIVVEKKPGSTQTRLLLVPTVRDRTLQTAVASHLSRSFEEEFLEASFAYRPGRGVDRAIARIRQLRDDGYWHVVDADIRGYFDNVQHHLLMREVGPRTAPPIDSWIHAWLTSPYWDGQRLRARNKGLPQGGPISPLLANLFLQKLDIGLLNAGGRLVRYADDFIVLAKSPEEAQQLLTLSAQILTTLGLELHPEKSRLANFDEGFRFLGVYFQKEEIWKPWKEHPNPIGRLLHFANPMPAWRLIEFAAPPSTTAIQSAIDKSGLSRWNRPKSTKTSSAEKDNDVAYLYLTEPGSILRKSGDRFLVEKDDQLILDVPYHKLEHILLFGHVQVTTQALHELLEKGVDLSIFSSRGQYRGSLSPPRSGNALDRIAQYQLWQDAPRALAWARFLVAAKIENTRTILTAWQSEWQTKDLSQNLESLSESVAAAQSAPSRDVLLGIEGNAAKIHFDALARSNRSAFVFPGRRKFPATDPINSLLSLTYTLLTQELGSLIESEGLDPCLGVFHEIDRSRPSLALDLVEPFRAAFADRFVLRLINRGILGSEAFAPGSANQSMMLLPAYLKLFLSKYEIWILAAEGGMSRRQRLRTEVRNLLAALRGKSNFQPFLFQSNLEDDHLPSIEV